MTTRSTCTACGSPRVEIFHEVASVPVNSVLSLDSRAEALSFPRGDIRLAFCDACGFIHNAAFEPERLEYSERYDPTQAFSPTFDRWHRALAEQLVTRHSLRGKRILEIGCGKGEFLALLCALGDNRGLGFDPAFVPERLPEVGAARVEFVADFYSERHATHDADFICCKMTLEHIHAPAELVAMLRRTIRDLETIVFFQVPDARRVLEECAFWDIYYEHCSYFSAGSLSRLFRGCGFDAHRLEREFGAQYVTIDARPAKGGELSPLEAEHDLEELRSLVRRFAQALPGRRDAWRARVRGRAEAGQRVALWGSGSKGVAFLTTLGLGREVSCVVDINPHRQGKYMLGTGHRIVSPEELRALRPDVVIVMNPVYRPEIEADLERLGLAAEVWTT